jgi:hypothetical protein
MISLRFEYTMEVLEGSMDMMKTLEDEVLAETNLIFAYVGSGEFLKAKPPIRCFVQQLYIPR